MAENERLKAWLEEGHALMKEGVFATFDVTFRIVGGGPLLTLGAPSLTEEDKLQRSGYAQALDWKRYRDA